MKLGGKIYEYTKVDKIAIKNGRVRGIYIGSKYVEANKVLVAAGVWSNETKNSWDNITSYTREKRNIDP